MLTGLILIVFFATCKSEMNVTGRINVIKDMNGVGDDKTSGPAINYLQSGKFNVGDVINFTFVLNFTGAQDMESIDLLISGLSMKFLWNKPNGGIFVKMKTDVMPAGTKPSPMRQQIRPSEDKTFAIVELENNYMPVLSAEGRFIMKVTDLTNIRGIIEVKPSLGESTIIYSEFVAVYVPPFNVSGAHPSSIGMMEETTFSVDIQLPLISTDSAYAKLYMPYSDNEAKMTVIDMAVTSVSGADKSIVDMINSRLNSALTKYSQSGTSEEDTAVFRFPTLNITDMNNEVVGFHLKCQGRLQDFIGFSAGSTLEVGTSLKVNDEFIWIIDIKVNISTSTAAVPKRPVLNGILEEFQSSSEGGLKYCKMRMAINHDQSSTGTAYNISVLFYLPPSISYLSSTKRYYDTVRRVHENEEENVVCFELPRVSFPHLSRLIFNVTVDIEKDEYSSTEEIPLVYEVIYTGWRSDEDFTTSLKSYHFKAEQEHEQSKAHVVGNDCPCSWDTVDRSCACCRRHSCHCGQQNKSKCVSCENMFHCIDTIEDYHYGSNLQDLNGTSYNCDNRKKTSFGRTSASCIARSKDGKERVLSPMVSTILGINSDVGCLFGLSNNGQGYVVSYDSGMSWNSIPSSIYINAKRSNSFLSASIIKNI